MNRLVNGIAGTWFLFLTFCVQAADETAAALEPAPRVNTIWVGVFFLVFVGVCAWFAMSIYRAEKKSKKDAQQSESR